MLGHGSAAYVSLPLQRWPPSPQSHRALTHDLPPSLSVQRTLSPLDVHKFPPPARRALTRSRLPQALAEPCFPLSSVSQYPLPFESPWSTDDEDDESAWETASATTMSSTTSALSPLPLSPSPTSPYPQPCVHNATDEDEEHHQCAMFQQPLALTSHSPKLTHWVCTLTHTHRLPSFLCSRQVLHTRPPLFPQILPYRRPHP